jgi:hypothetical protein
MGYEGKKNLARENACSESDAPTQWNVVAAIVQCRWKSVAQKRQRWPAVPLDKAAQLSDKFEDALLQITTPVRKRRRGVPNAICDNFLYV